MQEQRSLDISYKNKKVTTRSPYHATFNSGNQAPWAYQGLNLCKTHTLGGTHQNENQVGQITERSGGAIRTHKGSDVLLCIRPAHGQNDWLARVAQEATNLSDN